MSNFQMPVELFMSSPVHRVEPSENLQSVYSRLGSLGVTSLAVVDDAESLVGVISTTDLLRVGRRENGGRPGRVLLSFPDERVSERMTKEVVVVGSGDSIAVAAERMVNGHLHRVYVVEGEKLVGVLSTRDIMLAIRDKVMRAPIEDWMSSPAFTVRASENISLAVDRLGKAKVTGLIVVDDGWPVGLFTQREALMSAELPDETPVEAVMNAAMLILDRRTPLHRAAAQAAALHVRRVIAVKGDEVVGILTGLDFARAAL